jgi:hypothetical protein
MEVYARVRRAIQVDGMSIRQASRSSDWRGKRSARCWRIRCHPATNERSQCRGRSWGRGWASSTKFGRPGKGNDKGNVEGLVGYARRNFMVPVPRMTSWEELNAHLLEECRKRRGRKLWGQEETIAQRFERDREKLLPLPATPYEACEKRTTRASSQALVRYENNDYSVPVIRASPGAGESLRVGVSHLSHERSDRAA